MVPAVISEIRATLAVAVPLAAANLAQIAMGVIDTVMVGALGAVPLAAVGLGGGIYFTTAVTCQGLLNAVAPLAAFSVGAGDRAAAGRVAGSGLMLAVVLVVPVVAAMMTADRLLDGLGYDPALSREIGRFLRAVGWGAPGFLGFAVLRSLLSALDRARVVMLVLVLCVPTNAGLNWVFIYGHLGMPALGLVGCAYASATTQWAMLVGLAVAFWALPRGDPAHRLRGSLAGRIADIRRILVLGLPIAGLQAMEIGVFVTSMLLMGLFGADALAAHQIAINCASISFMVPLGIGQAATVRIAAERGGGRGAAARQAGLVALGLGVAFMAASAVVLATLPGTIVGAYVATGDPANRVLVALALQFLVIAAIFQIVDGIQVVAAGALRGYQDTAVPMLLAALGYWGIGFAGGWLFAFPLKLGPVGLWWGFVLGLGTVALLLTLRLLRRSRHDT
ncbi:MAG TPA: MATE family efflux transporter [Stellaceae bacterium]|nr:MATE family efflux transporter [Stellaceae bacterium]